MYIAIPLADKGFIPVDPISNLVRWYVERAEKDSFIEIFGPFESKSEAETYANKMNQEHMKDY